METLKIYLDSVFAAAPDSEDVRRVKAELLANMEEKYHELKTNGVSENEAIGAVISDFGNVDELFAEMGITPAVSGDASMAASAGGTTTNANAAPTYSLLSKTQITAFIETSKQSARGIGLGVLLCIMGVAQLILVGSFSNWFSQGEAILVEESSTGNIVVTVPESAQIFSPDFASLSVVLLFLFIIPAVGLFIHHGMKLSHFEDINEGRFRLDVGQRAQLKMTADELRSQDSRKVITGVTLILLGVVAIVLGGFMQSALSPGTNVIPQIQTIAVISLLLAIGISVRMFIVHFMYRGAYDKLLQRGDYTPENRKNDTIVGAIASFYWPLAVVVYLGWSFAFGAWHISWIIWPIAGVLFGGIAAFIPEARKAAQNNWDV
ncbi:MAG: permease prefix domain 1-containing protein [Coriobacteriia bacterium]|nr:permease prefix domain 1-containing protein [Coriobacteriia bacterium]